MNDSAIFHRSLQKTYPTAVGGKGVFLTTADGKRILDGTSGAAVSCLGHGNEEVIEAIVSQTRQLAWAHTAFFTSDPAEELARLLVDSSEGAFSKAVFLCSGSEAVESAIKMARQYHVYKGDAQRVNFIGRVHSYHGNTLGALSAGYHPGRRATVQPILSPAFHHVGRCLYDVDGAGLSEEAYEDGLIAEFEDKMRELGPDTVAAVIVEPVVGSTLGSAPATKTYLPRLKALCRQHGALLICDEVMCGLGRTGSYHAWQGLGGEPPDLQTVAKGLGGGYLPLSAVLMGPEVCSVFDEFSRGPERFVNGHTAMSHPTSCAGALAVQRIIHREGLVAQVQQRGQLLAQKLGEAVAGGGEVGGGECRVRGRGLFQTVDFGEAAEPMAEEVAGEAFARGLAAYPVGARDALLFAPPFVISDEEIGMLADVVRESVAAVRERRAKKAAGQQRTPYVIANAAARDPSLEDDWKHPASQP
ncbi:class-III aminotransferase [Stachybotrys elegans]|uniref:Class-III aminotransferase n=1 Tax=Stachybotrys elegans TaxID=80388 RepID=A0A8K0WVV3_9HYPO|nr:class-III aminotransferase [Stachybotrys elegans]